MEKRRRRKRRRGGIVVPMNPLVTSTDGMSAGAGDLMSPAIHGSIVGEEKIDDKNVHESHGIRWIRIETEPSFHE